MPYKTLHHHLHGKKRFTLEQMVKLNFFGGRVSHKARWVPAQSCVKKWVRLLKGLKTTVLLDNLDGITTQKCCWVGEF